MQSWSYDDTRVVIFVNRNDITYFATEPEL